jgi:hypothetical protein
MDFDWERLARLETHPIRIAVIEAMRAETPDDGGWSPLMLSNHLGVGLGNTSYHVTVLAKTGLLTLIKTEPRRGAVEHFYRLDASAGAEPERL